MKFKSNLVTQVSGSVGGTTFAHNRGGMYMRARSIPTNPNSTAQIAVRTTFNNLAIAWSQVLTTAQRTAWSNYAANSPVTDKFGDSMLLTGQQMFIRCNSVRLRGGAAQINDGPVTNGLVTLSQPLIAASIGAAIIAVVFGAGDAWAGESGGGLVVQTSRFRQPGINFHRSPFRFLGTIAGAGTPPASPADLGANNAFGEVVADAVEGQRIFGRFVAFRADGRISASLAFNGAVIA